jgi:hypothetical protein
MINLTAWPPSSESVERIFRVTPGGGGEGDETFEDAAAHGFLVKRALPPESRSCWICASTSGSGRLCFTVHTHT